MFSFFVLVAVDYEYFKPAERAILTLSSPDYMRDNLQALKDLTISAIPVRASPYHPQTQPRILLRTRGQRGRSEAARRGVLVGCGPSAGVTNDGRTVVFGGLSSRSSSESWLEDLLANFQIARSDKGDPQIVRLPL